MSIEGSARRDLNAHSPLRTRSPCPLDYGPVEARDGIEPSCRSALQVTARASENRASVLLPGVEPGMPPSEGSP